jgi:hypothetical protein
VQATSTSDCMVLPCCRAVLRCDVDTQLRAPHPPPSPPPALPFMRVEHAATHLDGQLAMVSEQLDGFLVNLLRQLARRTQDQRAHLCTRRATQQLCDSGSGAGKRTALIERVEQEQETGQAWCSVEVLCGGWGRRLAPCTCWHVA